MAQATGRGPPGAVLLALNDDEPLPASKHRIDGIYRRRSVVAGVFGMRAIESAVAQLAGSRVEEEGNTLDAFAVLWSARRQAEGSGVCLPTDPPLDVRGLPMQISF